MKTTKKKKPAKKIDLKQVLLIVIAIVVVLGVIAQILFNMFVWQELKRNSVFTTRQLIVNAIEELINQKTIMGSEGKISEARLQMPTTTPAGDQAKIVYSHYKSDGNAPEQIELTTRGIVAEGFGSVGFFEMEEVFKGVPKAQACTRGISIYINPGSEIDANNRKKIEEKQLADGRYVQIFRETECDLMQMDDLEKLVTQIQSY